MTHLTFSAKTRATNAKKLIKAAKQVIYDADHTPLKRLTSKQERALHEALRSLDLNRDYRSGYLLRQAFGVETDDKRGKDE